MVTSKPRTIRAISQADIPSFSDVISVSGSTAIAASGVGLGTDAKATVGAGVGVAVGEGEGVGASVAVGAGVEMGVGAAVGIGVGVAVGVRLGLGVGIAVGAGVGVGVGVGSGGDGGLTTVTSMVTVILNPAASVAVMTNDAVPASRGVMVRAPSSTTTEATLDSVSSGRVNWRASPSGSVMNSLRFGVVAGLPAVNSTTGTGIATGSSLTLVNVTVTSCCWDIGGFPSSVATTEMT